MGWLEKASQKGAWEQRHKGGEVSHVDLWGATAPDSGDRVSEGTEARAKAACPSKYRRASVAGVGRCRGEWS